MLIEGADYFVCVTPFPFGSPPGAVIVNADGTYTIMLDANVPTDVRMKTFEHEISHIQDDDFYNGKPIAEVETTLGRQVIRKERLKAKSWQEWVQAMIAKYGCPDDPNKVPEYPYMEW